MITFDISIITVMNINNSAVLFAQKRKIAESLIFSAILYAKE